jgi:hypothetical protein
MKRIIRLAVLTAGLLGLVGTTAPPAHANYVFAIAFVAQANVASGLDYPCAPTTGDPTLTTFTLPCPPTPPTVNTLPLNGLFAAPNVHLDYGHNRQAVTVAPQVCVGAAVATPEKSLFGQPAAVCSFAVGGTVSGYCGLSGGQVRGTVFNGHSILNVDIHFNGIAGVIVFDGHWNKPIDDQHGLLIGATLAIPPLPGSGQSCLDKTARTFTLVGGAVAVSDPTL